MCILIANTCISGLTSLVAFCRSLHTMSEINIIEYRRNRDQICVSLKSVISILSLYFFSNNNRSAIWILMFNLNLRYLQGNLS